jgi:non-canonical poly(A) RNA polymerase PAPD5/7
MILGSQRLHAEVLSFAKWIEPTAEEHELRSLVIEWVKVVVQSVISDAEIHPFGSYMTKLYLPGGCVLSPVSPSQVCSSWAHMLLPPSGTST